MIYTVRITREIKELQADVAALEKKRERSQASLINSVLDGTEPNAEDLDFFRIITAEIEVKRERLHELIKKRERLEEKNTIID